MDISDHGLKIGKEYIGTDAHKRTVQTVEYHFGNVQVKVHDTWTLKVEWLAAPEWNTLYPKNNISNAIFGRS